MMTLEISPGGAASKVLSYDGSLNGVIGDVEALTGTPDNNWSRFGADFLGSLAAFTYYDGTNWKLKVGTLSGTTITWGSAVTISGTTPPAANAVISVCILSSSLLAIGYKDSEGTPQFEIKTYSISGTTLTLDQTLNVAQATAATNYGVSLARVSASRLIALYPNSSTYPTVVGINASAGSLTRDASSTVIVSSAIGEETLAIRYCGGSGLLAFYSRSNALFRAAITDGGTSTSAGAEAQATPTTSGSPVAAAGSTGGVASVSGTGTGGIYPFTVSGGTITDEFLNTSTSDKLVPMGCIHTSNAAASDFKGAWLENPDGDGYSWAVFPCNPGNESGCISALFIGVSETGDVANTLRQTVRKITSSATNRRARTGKIVGVDSTTFILFYIDDTNADYKYLVCKL
jgi:hypothetical protein